MSQPITLEQLQKHVIDLANGLQKLNEYGPHVASVQAICAGILAPSPDEARASEDLAGLKAVLSRRGQIVSISADWDKDWHFIFQFRFAEGYYTGDGFDLRPGTPGFSALCDAIVACRLHSSDCDLLEPEQAGDVPSRRLIFPKPMQAAEPTTQTEPEKAAA